jgi:hypothetical protein
MPVRRRPHLRKVRRAVDPRLGGEDDAAEQERHGGAHAERARLERRVQRRLPPLGPPGHLPGSLGLEQRQELGVVEKAASGRAGPVCPRDDLLPKDDDGPDRELVHVEAPAGLNERLCHQLAVARRSHRLKRHFATDCCKVLRKA